MASLGSISSFGVDAYGEAVESFSYTSGTIWRISPPPATITANVSLPAVSGTPITWTATAAGGIPPLQYQFWRLKQGVSRVVAPAFGPSGTFTWTPGPPDVGTFLFRYGFAAPGPVHRSNVRRHAVLRHSRAAP